MPQGSNQKLSVRFWIIEKCRFGSDHKQTYFERADGAALVFNLAEEYALSEMERQIESIKIKRPEGKFCSVLVGRLISEQNKRVVSAK